MIRFTSCALLAAAAVSAQGPYNTSYKEPSDYTLQAMVDSNVNWDGRQTLMDLYTYGHVWARDDTVIYADGEDVPGYDLTAFMELVLPINKTCPKTFNQAAWDKAQAVSYTGIFKVQDKVYQARGYGYPCITIIEAPGGLIVVGGVESKYASAKAFNDYLEHVAPDTGANTTIAAIIISHSHIDHFGGIYGLVPEEEIVSGRMPCYGPINYEVETFDENMLLKPSMFRRGNYQYGLFLDYAEYESLYDGNGPAFSTLPFGFSPINKRIVEDMETHEIAGLTFEFVNAPGGEANAEFVFFIPELKMLTTEDLFLCTFPNIVTPRGAKARNVQQWTSHLTRFIKLFGDRMEYAITPHGPPLIGKENAIFHIKKFRDMLKFTHDQALRYNNLGFTMEEISETVKIPAILDSYVCTRPTYGSMKSNVKAIVQLYRGWFDGNPSEYQRLPPVERGTQYVADMGGVEEVMLRADFHLQKGNYRWCMEIMNHAVMAHPEHWQARWLLADCMEQYGFADESGIRRNYYLSGVKELRYGNIGIVYADNVDPSYFTGVPSRLVLQLLEIRVIPEESEKQEGLTFNMIVADEIFNLVFSNSVLQIEKEDVAPVVNCTVTTTTEDMVALVTTGSFGPNLVIDGDKQIFDNFWACISQVSDTVWNIIEPRTHYVPVPQCTYMNCPDVL